MRALLSVANREGISAFARELQRLDVQLFATDGTREHLAADGIEVGVRLRPDRGAAARRRPGPHVPPRDLRRDPRAPRRPRAPPAARRTGPRAARPRRRQRQAVRARGRPAATWAIDEAIEMIDVAGAALLGAGARNAAGVVAVCDPGHYGARPRRDADPRPGVGRHSLQARCGRLQHRRRVLRRDRRLPQPDRRQRLPQAARDGAREGRRPAVRREPAPAGGLLPRDDAPLGDALGRHPDRRARRRRSTTCSTSTSPTGSRRLHAPTVVSPSTPTRSASRRARSWSRPTGARWTRTRWRRSAASSASTASSTARPPARSRPTRTRR